MSTIVLNSLNYVGSGIVNGVSQFWERSKSLVSAFSTLTGRVNYGTAKTTVAWKLTVPVVKEDDTACGCAGEVVRTTIVDVSVRFDRSATSAERADVLQRLQDLVLTSQFAGSVSNLVQPE
jgi:hypothetical protein